MKKMSAFLICVVLILQMVGITALTGVAADEAADWEYTVSNDAATITGYNGADTAVVIPSELGGVPVTMVSSAVFQGKTAITAVTFPAMLTTIGSFAFSGCTGLTAVDLPANVSVVGRYAFASCKNLVTITVHNPYLTFGASAYPATTEVVYDYAFDVEKPHFTVDASNINLAILHTAGLTATRVYWGYAGTEEIKTQDWNTFAAAVPSAIRVNDYNPTDGENYAMTQSGYYLFWVQYTDASGATQSVCHTVAALGALDENYGKPYLEFDETGKVAWMNTNGTTVQKLYWGYIGDTDYKYETWDEFKTRIGDTYLPDYGPKDGEGYIVNKVGYYRFVIVYLDAQGVRQERYFTIQAETPATAPSIDNSTLSNVGVFVNEESYTSKVYYGYIGAENTKYVDFNTFKATAESFTTNYGTKVGTTFKLDQAGYWRFVVNYTVNDAIKDAIYTIYVDEADLNKGTPGMSQDENVVTLNTNGTTVSKMYIGYMGTDEVEVDTWNEYTSLRQSNAVIYGPKDGTTASLGATEGYYTVVLSYSNGGNELLEFLNFYVSADAYKPTYTVTFKDYDGTVLKTESVKEGNAATAPEVPAREGYEFTGWDVDFSNVTATLVVTAQYEETVLAPTFKVEKVEAAAGASQVAVTISVVNNPGIASIGLDVEYDPALTLTSVVQNSTIGGQFMASQTLESPARLIWVDYEKNVTGDWVFATLYFTVSETAEGELPISVSYNTEDVYNFDETNIAFEIVNGAVIVK